MTYLISYRLMDELMEVTAYQGGTETACFMTKRLDFDYMTYPIGRFLFQAVAYPSGGDVKY